MSIIDDMAERHILQSIERGELDNLPGQGKALVIDDDSFVPPQLKTAYRLLKNSGFLPPELEDRKKMLELADLLDTIDEDTDNFAIKAKELYQLEFKMKLAGMNTDFLRTKYRRSLAYTLGCDKKQPTK